MLLQILIISQDYDNKKDGIFLDGILKKMEKKIKKEEENGKKDGILLCLLFKKKKKEKKRQKKIRKKRWNILKKKNSLKNGELSEIPLLNYEGGPGVQLLNFEWGPSSRFPGSLGPVSRGLGTTFITCPPFLLEGC